MSSFLKESKINGKKSNTVTTITIQKDEEPPKKYSFHETSRITIQKGGDPYTKYCYNTTGNYKNANFFENSKNCDNNPATIEITKEEYQEHNLLKKKINADITKIKFDLNIEKINIPLEIQNIGNLKKVFGENFMEKDYREETLNIIKATNWNNDNRKLNKNCKLNKIFVDWKYAIYDAKDNNNIFIYKRNTETNNLNLIMMYKYNDTSKKYIQEDIDKIPYGFRINVLLYTTGEALTKENNKLYIINEKLSLKQKKWLDIIFDPEISEHTIVAHIETLNINNKYSALLKNNHENRNLLLNLLISKGFDPIKDVKKYDSLKNYDLERDMLPIDEIIFFIKVKDFRSIYGPYNRNNKNKNNVVNVENKSKINCTNNKFKNTHICMGKGVTSSNNRYLNTKHPKSRYNHISYPEITDNAVQNTPDIDCTNQKFAKAPRCKVITTNNLPENLKNIKELEQSKYFGVKFTEKDYKEETLELIFGKDYKKNGPQNYNKQKKCKLEHILSDWKYAILDGSESHNPEGEGSNSIFILKRNKNYNFDNNLDSNLGYSDIIMIKVYKKIEDNTSNYKFKYNKSVNNKIKINGNIKMPLFPIQYLLSDVNSKLYLIT